MITRVWKALATAESVSKYVAHFEHNVYPEIKEIYGFAGAQVMRKPVEGGVEIVVMTFWESMDAIRTFAGEDVTQAVVEPEAQAVLISYDTAVSHYDIMVSH